MTLPAIGQINLGGAFASIAMRSSSLIGVVSLLGVDDALFGLFLAATVTPDVELPSLLEDLGVRRRGECLYLSVEDNTAIWFCSLSVRSSDWLCLEDK